MKLLIFAFIVLFSVCGLLLPTKAFAAAAWWEVQSVDTMKFSRDMSRELAGNPQRLRAVSDELAQDIAQTGATHIAIATPYDAEFLPVLREWVAAARRHDLNVWFRGNWSGWEEWFEYAPISREEHLEKTEAFIQQNKMLFENGDIFTACPECENGGPGDPRMNGDLAGHRAFLVEEHDMMAEAFRSINKNVQINFNSMNGDVARLTMDPQTTQALGGFIVVDHYVEDPEQLDRDITRFAEESGGKVVLGEFGAPIPDIHGSMSEQEQAEWIDEALDLLSRNPHVVGINYWTSRGGSTALWSDGGTERQAVAVLTEHFSPSYIQGRVINSLGDALTGVKIQKAGKTVLSEKGSYTLPYVSEGSAVQVEYPGYVPVQTSLEMLQSNSEIMLVPVQPSLWYRFRFALNSLFF